MAGYGRDYGGYGRGRDPGWTGGGFYPGAGYRREGYFPRPGAYRRGLEIGPVWGGGSDIGYGVHPADPRRGYDAGPRRPPPPRSGGYDRGPGAPRRGPGARSWYW